MRSSDKPHHRSRFMFIAIAAAAASLAVAAGLAAARAGAGPGGIAAVSIVVGVLAAWRLGERFFLRSMAGLSEAARRLSVGEPGIQLPAVCCPFELDQVSQAMGGIGDALTKQDTHLSMLLHDTMGHHILNISYLAGGLRADLEKSGRPEAATAGRLEQAAREALATARRLSAAVLPIGAESLEEALTSLCAQARENFRIRCSFRGPDLNRRFDGGLAVHLYAIAREAVLNSARHGKATDIAVVLSQTPGALMLTVDDDGDGLASASAAGTGIRLMRYRAELIGAELRILTRPEGGTQIRCRLPERP